MEALGIDLKLLIAQIVNFLVLFVLLSKFLYKPITKLLSERQEKIAEGIANAEKAAKALNNAEKESEKIREKAYKEADEILKSAKDEANKEAAEIVKKASNQAQRTLDAISKEKASFKDQTLLEVKKETSDVIILALDKIVGGELTEAQKKEVTAKVLKEM